MNEIDKSGQLRAAEIIPKTLAIAESARTIPTTQPLPQDGRVRRWLDKWVRLETGHSQQLRIFEEEIYRFCHNYSRRPSHGYRLVVYGRNGVGKSHSAKAIGRWAKFNAIQMPCVQTGEWFGLARCEYLLWPEFLKQIKSTEDWGACESANENELLILDDVGAEHDPSRFGSERIYWLLERREFRWTMITTNYAPEHWSECFENRIASRLLRNTRIVDLSSVPDFGAIHQ